MENIANPFCSQKNKTSRGLGQEMKIFFLPFRKSLINCLISREFYRDIIQNINTFVRSIAFKIFTKEIFDFTLTFPCCRIVSLYINGRKGKYLGPCQ